MSRKADSLSDLPFENDIEMDFAATTTKGASRLSDSEAAIRGGSRFSNADVGIMVPTGFNDSDMVIRGASRSSDVDTAIRSTEFSDADKGTTELKDILVRYNFL